ncbi:ECF RNA polymerase sigma factor SigR [Firmicutes bacterium ASF500]|nr:ECF RNA polymerase sigma factor SigR [Firmicutes bacterium ASF500]
METVRSQEEVASLYRRHVDMVYQICLMLMKNVPDAEDAVQTVFRKVMEYDRPFRDHEHEKAWLIVTARNECRNQLKHWWRTRRESEEVLNTLAWEQPEDGALWETILRLPEKYRLVLYLHYYQGYTALETAEILGRNPSTVRGWLVQARGKLKELLEAESYEGKTEPGF